LDSQTGVPEFVATVQDQYFRSGLAFHTRETTCTNRGSDDPAALASRVARFRRRVLQNHSNVDHPGRRFQFRIRSGGALVTGLRIFGRGRSAWYGSGADGPNVRQAYGEARPRKVLRPGRRLGIGHNRSDFEIISRQVRDSLIPVNYKTYRRIVMDKHILGITIVIYIIVVCIL